MDKPINSVLAFDFGTKRFGVAIGQSITGTASPLEPFKVEDGIPNWDIIDKLVEQWKPDAFVVGMPLNMDGSMSDMAMRANKFRKRLLGRYNLPSIAQDERLTSFEAKSFMLKQGKTNFKEHSVDGIAAMLICESYFESLSE